MQYVYMFVCVIKSNFSVGFCMCMAQGNNGTTLPGPCDSPIVSCKH